MSIEKIIPIGFAANEISKQITGSDEVSLGRTTIAAGAGAALGAGACAAGSACACALGFGAVAAAPIVLPAAICAGIFAGITSLFD